ncbi:MAG: SDR family oxidoreductase [Myxococcota bacterium]|nr:SDR family oxidoreductase [Myxococcota bacterium]MDW8363399.1 SDR family oxidoreductase [Myxococcales bacterium]
MTVAAESGALARFRLDGRVAVVTGGSRGIGRAIAFGLAEAGASVAIAARDPDRCAATASEMAARGARAIAVAADVSRDEEVERLFERVDRELGPARVLIACAGVATGGPSLQCGRDELQRMLDVHLLGPIAAARAAALRMQGHGGGSIVFVTSVWGLGGASRTLAYGTAKAALAHAVRVLAVEWAPQAIRVNGLAPGIVDTDMTASLDPGAREALLRKIPMRRAARPDEMVGPALLLASDAGSFLTGHVLVVDGGERAR